MDDHETYGIDKATSHPRAVELVPEKFFWDCADELAPFGSDEGDTGLSEYRDWRRDNPNVPILGCLKWVVEGVGEIQIEQYDDSILDESLLSKQIEDPNYDDQQYIYTLDVSIISTIFGQLVDEGVIDDAAKPIGRLAINRQILWSKLQSKWPHSATYIGNLEVLLRVINEPNKSQHPTASSWLARFFGWFRGLKH